MSGLVANRAGSPVALTNRYCPIEGPSCTIHKKTESVSRRQYIDLRLWLVITTIAQLQYEAKYVVELNYSLAIKQRERRWVD